MNMMLADPAGRREKILSAAVSEGLLDSEEAPLAAFIDIDGVAENVAALRAAFPDTINVLHTFAVKANSIIPVLAGLNDLGMGCEVASDGELAQALSAGIVPERIVFDSPAKSRSELLAALKLGVALNVDNFQELARIQQLRKEVASRSPVGIRINPQVGVGGITEMSTAGDRSKFGVPLNDPGNRRKLLSTYAEEPWLNRIHAHVGSQGCPLPLIGAGVAKLVAFADEVNAAAGWQQITTIDIGGGLPVDFESDELISNFEAYTSQLQESAPRLFSGDYEVITEFGRSVLAKFGFTAAYIEYTKVAGGHRMAISHAGAQVATRTVFAPASWPIRIEAHTGEGSRKVGTPVAQDVAGPCCFAGDVVAHDRDLPLLEPGDLVALLDTGAYYSSNHFNYNSLRRPAVYGASIADDGDVQLTVLREAQTVEELLAASGYELVRRRVPWAKVPGDGVVEMSASG